MKRSTVIGIISGLLLAGSILFSTVSISASSNRTLSLHNYVCAAKHGCSGKRYNATTGKLSGWTWMLKGTGMNATPKQGYLWESTNKSTYRARWIGSQFVKRGETPRY